VSELVPRAPFPTATTVEADPGPVDTVHPALVLPGLLALARHRLRWVSDQLGEQIERQGLRGVIDARWGITAAGDAVQLGEEVRALVQLESQERDRCAALAERIARLGMDAREGTVTHEVAGHKIVLVMEAFAELLGLDWADPSTRRLAQRAGIIAREREIAAASRAP